MLNEIKLSAIGVFQIDSIDNLDYNWGFGLKKNA